MYSFLKGILKTAFGEYGIYRIYRCEACPSELVNERNPEDDIQFVQLSPSHLQRFATAELAKTYWYEGDHSVGFGAISNGVLVAIQWYWFGDQSSKQDPWPIQPEEIKSVHMETLENYRGKGIGRKLKAYSMRYLLNSGYTAVISRVWHNNWPSIRVNESLEAQQVGWLVELNPFRRSQPFQYIYRKHTGRSLRKYVTHKK